MRILSTAGAVVSGFPGIGKSTFAKKYEGEVSDSDSSKFDKALFPANYIDHINKQRHIQKWTLVSSHDVVRQALVTNNIPFTLVYPERSCKQEYVDRYSERGSPKAFVDLLSTQWDNFITGCEQQTGCKHVVLKSGQFLADVL